jgi:transcriptional regulator with PAS, ATPase and Fis domain
MESELFGYDGGAFTGAVSTGKIGKFELASGGTIFLDEIGTMPLEMQAKLLRVLEEREFEHVGGNDKIEVDVRVIAATNEDLRSLVSEGKFREDLYYRLDVVSLKIPPLVARPGDIPLLAQNMLQNFLASYPHGPSAFSDGAMKLLKMYDWPGNVRELRNVVERSINMARSRVIYSKDLPHYIRSLNTDRQFDEKTKTVGTGLESNARSSIVHSSNAVYGQDAFLDFENGSNFEEKIPVSDLHSLSSTTGDLSKISNGELNLQHQIELLEQRVIEEALRRCDGNKTESAKLLGLHRTSLYKKLEKYAL